MTSWADVDAGRAFVLAEVAFAGRVVLIAKQTIDGACPLLSLFNALSLAGHPHPLARGIVPASALINVIVARIRSRADSVCTLAAGARVAPGGPAGAALVAVTAAVNAQRVAAEGAMGEFVRGMDLDVIFSDARLHTETPATRVFACCGVSLLHAWVVDADGKYGSAIVDALGDLSFERTQIALMGIEEEGVEPLSEQTRAMMAEWLSYAPPWKMTERGRQSALAAMVDEQCCVLMLNGHFFTALRHHGELFLLVNGEQQANGSWLRLVKGWSGDSWHGWAGRTMVACGSTDPILQLSAQDKVALEAAREGDHGKGVLRDILQSMGLLAAHDAATAAADAVAAGAGAGAGAQGGAMQGLPPPLALPRLVSNSSTGSGSSGDMSPSITPSLLSRLRALPPPVRAQVEGMVRGGLSSAGLAAILDMGDGEEQAQLLVAFAASLQPNTPLVAAGGGGAGAVPAAPP